MGEFERNRMQGAGTNNSAQRYPSDFSAEEAEFAAALRDLFPIEEEELPPLFVPTLLDDPWHAPLGPGFEQKTAAAVFRRLSLQRSLLARRSRAVPTWSAVVDSLEHVGRPVFGVLSVLLLLMVFSVVVATPSFANGLRILLGQTGVDQVSNYPQDVRPSNYTTAHDKSSSAHGQAPLYWLGPTIGSYVYQSVWQLDAQEWTDGPIIELQYVLPHAAQGTGILDVREFRLSPKYAAVLQVVQLGSAAAIQAGQTPAVYVDGGWADTGTGHMWRYGERSELIFEQHGIVFWIVADQRDGMNQSQLVDAVSHLALAGSQAQQLNALSPQALGHDLTLSVHDPVEGEVYRLVPKGASLGSSLGAFVLVHRAPHLS